MKSGFTLSYIPISSMTLMKLLSMGSTPLERIKGDGRHEDQSSLWRKYFNVNAVETRSARFDERILSDGKGVSIQRKTCYRGCGCGIPADASRHECQLTLSSELDTATTVFRGLVDPGMTDIVTYAFEDGAVGHFSSGRFSELAGYGRKMECPDATEALVRAIPPPTTTDLTEHATAYLAALPTLLQHRAAKGYRSMRFSRFMGKQKAIETVCDEIAPTDRMAVVGFGDWSNNGSGISRRCSGPIKEIKHRLSHRPNVLFKSIDEYRSSCICNSCHSRLTNMRAAESVVRKRSRVGEHEGERLVVRNNKVHKVLHCCDSVKSAPENGRCGATWNRDVNASKNILMFLRLWIADERRSGLRASAAVRDLQPRRAVVRRTKDPKKYKGS